VERSRRGFLSSLLLASIAGTPGLARACAFDGIFDGSLGYIHPRAVEVALAVRHAVSSGLLPEEALTPLTPGAAGLWEAVSMLRDVGQRMSHARLPSIPCVNIALLLSESSLWTRYVCTPQRFETFTHANGPESSDIVIVTDLAVVTELQKGRLSVSVAIARNLLFIEGSSDSVEAAATLITRAYGDGATAGTNLTNRLPWHQSNLR
jgi:hypothetical protein